MELYIEEIGKSNIATDSYFRFVVFNQKAFIEEGVRKEGEI